MKAMRGFGWSFKQVLGSMQNSFAMGLGLSQVMMVGAIASENLAVVPQSGTYLYGEANTVNQLGKQYVIFAQSGQQIVGALYSPQSEYSCFMGQRTNNKLTVQVFESIAQVQTHPQPSFQLQLPTLNAISHIGPKERQVLASCQQEALMLKSHKLAQPSKPSRTTISMH
jgi:hypothetical protein